MAKEKIKNEEQFSEIFQPFEFQTKSTFEVFDEATKSFDNGASDDEDYYKGPSIEELRKKYAEDGGKIENPSIEIPGYNPRTSTEKPHHNTKESDAEDITLRSYTNLPPVYLDHVYDDVLPMDDNLKAFLQKSQDDYKRMAELDKKLARPNPKSKHSVPYSENSGNLFLYPL